MVQRFLNSDLLIPSIVCFLLGSFGYIIVRLWMIPLITYWCTKRKVVGDLSKYIEHFDRVEKDDIKTELRKRAASLTNIFNNSLPYWYRLYLENRSESPIEAAKTIMKLVNTKNKAHINTQIKNILTSLNK